MITESDMLNETIRTQQAEIERLKEYEDAVYAHFDVACHSYDASKSVYDNLSMLQSWHCDIALDPKVSKPANDLHDEIYRLKGQRDRLLQVAKNFRDGSGLDKPIEQIIAEIEAEK